MSTEFWLDGISVIGVRHMTCRRGAEVMRRIARYLDGGDYRHLGLARPRVLEGYSCRAWLIGDSAWKIRCLRFPQRVDAFTAE